MGNNHNKKSKNSYYNLLNKTLKKIQKKNCNNINNINYCLITKSFSSSYNHEPNLILENENISWETYLKRKLLYLSNNYDYIWAKNLYLSIKNNNFPNQYKYRSIFFFEEYQTSSVPKLSNFHPIIHYWETNSSIFKKTTEKNIYEINIDSSDEEEIIEKDNRSTNISNKNGYKEIIDNMYTKNKIRMSNDVLGSLASISLDEINSFLLENDPTLEYKVNKAKLKEYIDIFRRHLCHKDHPINIIFNMFSKEFKPIIIKTISTCKNNPNINESSKKCLDIIHQLQEFIITLQIVIKLFYSKCISYEVFMDEKDEFINLIAFLLFNTGNIYKYIYKLLVIINSEKIKNFDNQLDKFKEMKPEDFGVSDIFCLTDTTREYMDKYKNKKIKLLNQKPELKERLLNINKNNKDQENIDDIDEEEKERQYSDNIIKKNRDNFNIPKVVYDVSNYTMPKMTNFNILGFLNEPNSKENKNENDIFNLNLIDTLNNNNNEGEEINQILNINLTISEKENKNKKNQFLLKFARTYSNILSYNETKTNEPYYEAIKALKNIVKCKTPLEKLIIMASLSSFITDNIYIFWKPIEELINPSLLNVEADELMKIILYIVYKSEMSELFVHFDFVKYFTIRETRTTMIGYYYTLLEGTLNTILSAKDKTDFLKNEKHI